MKRSYYGNIAQLITVCYNIGLLEQDIIDRPEFLKDDKLHIPAFRKLRLNRLKLCEKIYREILEQYNPKELLGYNDLDEYRKEFIKSMCYPTYPKW